MVVIFSQMVRLLQVCVRLMLEGVQMLKLPLQVVDSQSCVSAIIKTLGKLKTWLMECLFQIRQVQNPLIWKGILCLYRSESPPSQTALRQEIVTFRKKKAQNDSQV